MVDLGVQGDPAMMSLKIVCSMHDISNYDLVLVLILSHGSSVGLVSQSYLVMCV